MSAEHDGRLDNKSFLHKKITRRRLVLAAAAGAVTGGIGLSAYTDHEADSLQPEIDRAQAEENKNPSAYGNKERTKTLLYNEHNIPLQRRAALATFTLGASTILADGFYSWVKKEIHKERSLSQPEDPLSPTQT